MSVVRIGTWNLAGRWSSGHAELIESANCDVWLLTEVSDRLDLPGFMAHFTKHDMAKGRRYAAVASRAPFHPLPDPHPASAMATIGETTFICSVLPWRTCGSDTWGEGGHGVKTERAVAQIAARLPGGPLVWGGDWNHALDGPEYAGSQAGRRALFAALEDRDLRVPTQELPAAGGGRSIDHIAVASHMRASTEHVTASDGTRRLSDHDAYVVQVED